MQRFYNESKEAALQAVKSSSQGLTQAEARARLERNGKNQLAQGKKDSLLKRFFLQMADPMILILLAAAAISGALAVYENESFTDVIIILFVVVVNAVLGVYQENKAEKAIEALQEMAAATSKVLRDGQMMTVRSEDLVVGDVVLLEAGDAVPADGRILESASLKIEEAALEKINSLGIGPQGFGGKTTAIGVSCELAPTHIAGLPVAVNIQCHCVRCAKSVI